MVKNFLKNSTDFLFKKQTNILSAAVILSTAVMASRVLGLLKYRLLTDRFSVSDIGIFIAAFRLPNTIFDLVVMGVLTTTFIPIFTSYLAKDKFDEANKIASTIINFCIIAFTFLSLIFLLFTQPLLNLIAPGLSKEEIALAVPFTKIMLVGQTLPLILGNFLTALLQSHKRFLLPAIAPLFYNLGIIIGIIFLSPMLGLFGPVWGVVLGAILFLLIQIPISIHLKFRYQPILDLKNRGVVEIGKLVVPRAFGLVVTQLGYIANLVITSLIGTRAITIFSFAQQLAQLPVGIFAATIATAALPTLSEETEKDDQLVSFKKTFLTSFHQILFLTLPAAVILIILRIPIVRLVYGSTKFDWPATVETGRTLAFLGIGLVAESAINLIVRGFYALHDSKTPVILGSLSILFNVIFSITIIFGIKSLGQPIWGLSFSSAIADVFLAVFLLYLLHIKSGGFSLKSLIFPAVKMAIAAILTGISLYIPLKLLDQLVFDTTHTISLLALTVTTSIIGLTVYAFFTWLLQIEELKAFLGLFAKLKRVEASVSETISQAPPETFNEK